MSFYGHLQPGRYLVGDDGVARKQAPSRKRVLQGHACHYNVPHQNYKNGLTELFEPGCFSGSLDGVLFFVDHKMTDRWLGDEFDGSLELHDSDEGLACRLHLKDGHIEKLEGRASLSVGYAILDSKVRADGVLVIKSATLLEISACDVGAVRQAWSEIRDLDSVKPLAEESKDFAYTGASLAVTRALRNL